MLARKFLSTLSGSTTGAVCTQGWATKPKLVTRRPILGLQPNSVSTKPGEGHFDVDKANIKDSSRPELDEIGAMLKRNPSLKLLVVGHTDSQGGFNYNMDLSRKRAVAVVHDLVVHYGIAPIRLRPVGVGYSCPAASNRTEEGRAKNRRVVLVEDH